MSKERANDKDFTPLTEQAAHWWAVLHSENVTAADYREFSEWVLRSPERVEAILQTARLMRALQSGEVRWPDTSVETLIREARDAHADVVVPLHSKAGDERETQSAVSSSRARSFVPRFAGLAATVAIAAVGSWFAFAGPDVHRTVLGEQLSIVLDDGSLVTLNTSSEIEVAIDDERRVVHLNAGEALFQVARDEQRPFEVVTANATVRAVGTQFNVDRHAADTTVTVVEGKVAVTRQTRDGAAPVEPPLMLASAQRAVINEVAVSAPLPVANLAAATAWTQRRLVFERRPLGEVATEFNRYNRRRIVIDSPELRDQEVTGVFQANDPDSFVSFLSGVPGVHVQQNGSSISVTARD